MMTFRERYQNSENTWHTRVVVMEIYHLTMLHRERGWTIGKTANYFNCSIGLVSENLRLAQAIHVNSSIVECPSRQDALLWLSKQRRYNGRDVDTQRPRLT